MVNITLAVSTEMKSDMDQFPEMNWSEIARAAIKERLEMMEKFRKFTEKSALTEEDALNLGRELKQKTIGRR